MTFHEFATAMGLVVYELRPDYKIHRCPTTTHPNSKNGAYFWNGEYGWVSDWANGDEIKPYKSSDKIEPIIRVNQAAIRESRSLEHSKAAEAAARIIKDCKQDKHYYLNNKGFSDNLGLIYEDETSQPQLIIPMRDFFTSNLLGVQRIQWEPEQRGGKYVKKMLHGMRAKGAVLFLGNPGSSEYCLCEGYATGLSIQKAVSVSKLDICVVVCFSDSNLVHVAGLIWDKHVFVYADNDESKAGESAAKKTGFSYVMSDKIGNDANDDMMEFGINNVIGKIIGRGIKNERYVVEVRS